MQVESFEAFKSKALDAGFEEVLVREWAPHTIVQEHAHPFDADALVTQGEMWLTSAEGSRHLLPGGRFRLAAGTPHSERYGPDGATYWVARRSASLA